MTVDSLCVSIELQYSCIDSVSIRLVLEYSMQVRLYIEYPASTVISIINVPLIYIEYCILKYR